MQIILQLLPYALFKKGDIDKKEVNKIYKDLGIDASKPNPWEV